MRVVIPSVNYGDLLAVTLPAWRRLLPRARFTVVTSPLDAETLDVCERNHTRAVVTDVWTAAGAKFNKGGALDLGFGFNAAGAPGHGETCLSIDADVYPFGSFPDGRLAKRNIYGCPRYVCWTPEELEGHAAGVRPLADFPLILPRQRGQAYALETMPSARTTAAAGKRCLGFFQLFRYTPGLAFGHSRTAGKCDIVFRNQFEHWQVLPDFYVLHLGESTRANWAGRLIGRWGQ